MTGQVKPGCFSSPYCFDALTPPCSNCNWREECQPAAMRVAADLRSRFGIDRVGERKVARGVAPVRRAIRVEGGASIPPPVVMDGLSTHAANLVDTIQKAGINLAEALHHGRNPFLTRPPGWMRLMVQGLLDGGYTREEAVRLMLDMHPALPEPVAVERVAHGISAMIALGAVEEKDGRIVRKAP